MNQGQVSHTDLGLWAGVEDGRVVVGLLRQQLILGRQVGVVLELDVVLVRVPQEAAAVVEDGRQHGDLRHDAARADGQRADVLAHALHVHHQRQVVFLGGVRAEVNLDLTLALGLQLALCRCDGELPGRCRAARFAHRAASIH